MRRAAALLLVALAAASCQQGGDRKAKPEERAVATKGGPKTAVVADAEKKPPPLQIEAWVNSEPLELADLKGKVVVLDFWAIYCAPCVKLMPHLGELYGKHKAEGLIVIGVTENRKGEVETFAQRHKIAYPLAIDKLVEGAGQTHHAYGIVALPMAYVVGRDGRVAWQGRGDQLTAETILAELAKK